jgi:hypothetical protein
VLLFMLVQAADAKIYAAIILERLPVRCGLLQPVQHNKDFTTGIRSKYSPGRT